MKPVCGVTTGRFSRVDGLMFATIRTTMYVIPRRGEAPTWESPVIWMLRTVEGGDCHVARRAPRNDMRFRQLPAKLKFAQQ